MGWSVFYFSSYKPSYNIETPHEEFVTLCQVFHERLQM